MKLRLSVYCHLGLFERLRLSDCCSKGVVTVVSISEGLNKGTRLEICEVSYEKVAF